MEVLLAGLLFSLASAGSLQLMAGMGRSLQGAAQAEAVGAQLEAELRRSDALVLAGAQQGQATDLACDQPELLLSHLLTDPATAGEHANGNATASGTNTSPNGPGMAPEPSQTAAAPLVREVSVLAPGLVRLQLTADGGRWQRQRLFSAAAYGLCPPAGGAVG
jgi:hypothetical protein